ncbi:MAG: endonuclease, partial [Modestobacter sp.]|nr:endonuclease [Modestobacter sp.]
MRECELIGAAESDGLKTMQSWRRGHAHLADSEEARLAGAGRALEQLPAVAAGFADGAVTPDQVAVAAPVVAVDNQQAAAAQG